MQKILLVYLITMFSVIIPQSSESALLSEVTFQGSYDSNAFVTKASQFIEPPRGDHIYTLGLGIFWDDSVFLNDSLSVDYQLDFSRFLNMKSQNARRHLFEIKYERNINQNLTVVPDLNVEYYNENNHDWSYFRLRPSILLSHFADSGLISEIFYEWRDKQFYDKRDKNSYQNVGSNLHSFDFKFKFWHTSFLRSTVRYIFDYEKYGQNISPTLLIYTGLSPDQYRRDMTHSFRLEEMVVFSNNVIGNLLYEHQNNQANTDPYTYRANRFGLRMNFEPISSHSLFLEINYTIYDYFKYQFDTRYTNTRKDSKTDLIAIYQIEINQRFFLELKYSFSDNDSNDTIDFDPAFTTSYSSYSQKVFSVSLKGDL